MVLARESPAEVQATLDNGAAGIFRNPYFRMSCRKAIHIVLVGGMYLPPELLGHRNGDQPVDRLETSFGQLRLSEEVACSLTLRQREVMRYLALRRSSKAIAQEVKQAKGTANTHVPALLRYSMLPTAQRQRSLPGNSRLKKTVNFGDRRQLA